MLRILIAEDEPRLAAFLEKGLAASGYSTTTVHNGRTALSIARDDSFDMLLLDIGLPDLDGLTVLRRIRERGDQLPIIAMSAREQPPDHGADDYLSKPFSVALLLARVREQLRAAGS